MRENKQNLDRIQVDSFENGPRAVRLDKSRQGLSNIERKVIFPHHLNAIANTLHTYIEFVPMPFRSIVGSAVEDNSIDVENLLQYNNDGSSPIDVSTQDKYHLKFTNPLLRQIDKFIYFGATNLGIRRNPLGYWNEADQIAMNEVIEPGNYKVKESYIRLRGDKYSKQSKESGLLTRQLIGLRNKQSELYYEQYYHSHVFFEKLITFDDCVCLYLTIGDFGEKLKRTDVSNHCVTVVYVIKKQKLLKDKNGDAIVPPYNNIIDNAGLYCIQNNTSGGNHNYLYDLEFYERNLERLSNNSLFDSEFSEGVYTKNSNFDARSNYHKKLLKQYNQTYESLYGQESKERVREIEVKIRAKALQRHLKSTGQLNKQLDADLIELENFEIYNGHDLNERQQIKHIEIINRLDMSSTAIELNNEFGWEILRRIETNNARNILIAKLGELTLALNKIEKNKIGRNLTYPDNETSAIIKKFRDQGYPNF